MPHKFTQDTQLTFGPKPDLDLEFWGIKIPKCASSHADKFLLIQFYVSIVFTFGVMNDTKY